MRPHRSLVRAAASTLAALALVVVAAGGANARSSVITIAIDLDAGLETFTTDSPLLCPTGVAYTDFHFGAGNFWAAGTFHLDKLLVCDDDSGSFVIAVNAGSNMLRGTGTQGGWSVVPGSGTGDYAGLQGGGSIFGIPGDGDPIDLVDHYYGSVGF
jgi:hypothetical protein